MALNCCETALAPISATMTGTAARPAGRTDPPALRIFISKASGCSVPRSRSSLPFTAGQAQPAADGAQKALPCAANIKRGNQGPHQAPQRRWQVL